MSTYTSGEPVRYKGKRYDFGYFSKEKGFVVIYEEGCRNMQDSFAVPLKDITRAKKQYTVRVEIFVTFEDRPGLTTDDISVYPKLYVRHPEHRDEYEKRGTVDEVITSLKIQSKVDIS